MSLRATGGNLMDQCSTATPPHQRYGSPHHPPGHDLDLGINHSRPYKCSPASGSATSLDPNHINQSKQRRSDPIRLGTAKRLAGTARHRLSEQ